MIIALKVPFLVILIMLGRYSFYHYFLNVNKISSKFDCYRPHLAKHIKDVFVDDVKTGMGGATGIHIDKIDRWTDYIDR